MYVVNFHKTAYKKCLNVLKIEHNAQSKCTKLY